MPTFKIAIIGAGPAGYFAAQALQNAQSEDKTFAIDMIERLPTPWGLVRSGVAPDHPKIKTVSKVFEKVANEPNFRLFANVELGSDLTIEQLTEKYDAVVIATGSALGKKLGIPGEDLAGSMSAATFVPWYNAHPDFKDENIDLSFFANKMVRRKQVLLLMESALVETLSYIMLFDHNRRSLFSITD